MVVAGGNGDTTGNSTNVGIASSSDNEGNSGNAYR